MECPGEIFWPDVATDGVAGVPAGLIGQVVARPGDADGRRWSVRNNTGRPIKSVGVVGAEMMGTAIAAASARYRLPVVMSDVCAEAFRIGSRKHRQQPFVAGDQRPRGIYRLLPIHLELLHFQFRISGRSSPYLSMYCLCSISLSLSCCFR